MIQKLRLLGSVSILVKIVIVFAIVVLVFVAVEILAVINIVFVAVFAIIVDVIGKYGRKCCCCICSNYWCFNAAFPVIAVVLVIAVSVVIAVFVVITAVFAIYFLCSFVHFLVLALFLVKLAHC